MIFIDYGTILQRSVGHLTAFMGRLPTMCLLASCLLLLSPAAESADEKEARTATAREILTTVERRMWPASFQVFFELIKVSPGGQQSKVVAYAAKKGGDRWVALIVSPKEDKGKTLLRVGDQWWYRLPTEVDPHPTSEADAFISGMFLNADIFRLDFLLEYTPTDLVDWGKEYKITLKAIKNRPLYESIVINVRRDLMVPTEMRYFSAGSRQVKVVRFKEIQPFDNVGLLRPSMLETKHLLTQDYVNILHIGRIEARDFPDSVFTLDFLPHVGTLLKE